MKKMILIITYTSLIGVISLGLRRLDAGQHTNLLEKVVVDGAAQLCFVRERHGVVCRRFHPPQLEYPHVVITGDEQRVVGGRLQV
jgi:hypothetical protein